MIRFRGATGEDVAARVLLWADDILGQGREADDLAACIVLCDAMQAEGYRTPNQVFKDETLTVALDN